ncbi:MAG: DUF5711 family protein [Oscillospiraceae bacterium]|nr:DUF5711 family protein [Oscillospiraceae bacterium]
MSKQKPKPSRKEKISKLPRLLILLVFVAAFTGVGLFAMGNVRLSPISDLQLLGRQGDGFPIEFSYSHARQAAAMGNSVALLGPTQFDIVSQNGYRSVQFAQPYAMPALRTAGNRAVLFDRNLGNITMFRRGGILATHEMGQSIFTVDINPQGAIAVATRSDRAAAEIFVYNPRARQQLHWQIEREHPVALRLSNNGRVLAMCLAGTEQAGVYARFVDFPLNAQQPRTDIRLPGVWLYDTASIAGGWLAVGNEAVYLIRHGASTAEELSFGGRTLRGFSLQNNGYSAVLLEDWDHQVLLRVYNSRGTLAAEHTLEQQPYSVIAQGRAVYLHMGDMVLRWRPNGFSQSQPLPAGTQSVVIAGREVYALSVRHVEHMRLRWSAADV